MMADGERDRSDARDEEELKVTDRRLFTADGKLRSETIEEPQDPPAEEEEEEEGSPRSESRTEQPEFERRSVEEPQGVDFTMLINAMAEPALLFLGEIQPPGGDPAMDLGRARIQIDMLDLLRVKCRGNLTPEEEGLLDRILYQLRMLYVARADRPPQT